MPRYALVDSSGLITNVIELVSGANYTPPSGLTLAQETTTIFEIGGTIIASVYTPPPPPAAATWADVRNKRNHLLAASDWAMLSDNSGANANRLAWVQYRQALKDVPQNFATPDVVVWPTPPAYVKSTAAAVQFYRVAATFGAALSFTLPTRCYIKDIILANTTPNPVTGGLKFGTTIGGADVVVAVPVGANAVVSIPDAQILKRFFSLAAPQTIFIDAVTAWNGASITGAVIYGQL